MEVLDVPCGFGRIANRLAARGCRVTGLDASPLFLARARQDAAALGVAVEYVAGDMRALPWAGRFDRLVCWFTSFGYFDDATDRRVLAGFRRALRPGGRLVLDHANLARLVRAQPSAPAPSTGLFADLGEEACSSARATTSPPAGSSTSGSSSAAGKLTGTRSRCGGSRSSSSATGWCRPGSRAWRPTAATGAR